MPVSYRAAGQVAHGVRRPPLLRWVLSAAIAAAVLGACYGDSEQASSLDAAAFQEASGQLESMIEGGRTGDADGVEEAFAQVRGFLLQLDRALAAMPEQVIARAELFDAVMRIDRELAGERRPDVLADIAEDARRSLTGASAVLGHPQ